MDKLRKSILSFVGRFITILFCLPQSFITGELPARTQHGNIVRVCRFVQDVSNEDNCVWTASSWCVTTEPPPLGIFLLHSTLDQQLKAKGCCDVCMSMVYLGSHAVACQALAPISCQRSESQTKYLEHF